MSNTQIKGKIMNSLTKDIGVSESESSKFVKTNKFNDFDNRRFEQGKLNPEMQLKLAKWNEILANDSLLADKWNEIKLLKTFNE